MSLPIQDPSLGVTVLRYIINISVDGRRHVITATHILLEVHVLYLPPSLSPLLIHSLTLSLPPSSPSQDTLEEASALLKEIEARDSRQVPQVTSDNKQHSETSDELSSNTQQSNLDRLEG